MDVFRHLIASHINKGIVSEYKENQFIKWDEKNNIITVKSSDAEDYYKRCIDYWFGKKVKSVLKDKLIRLLVISKNGGIKEEYHELYEYALSEICNIATDTLPTNDWKCLVSFFQKNGLFRLSYECRNKYKRRVYENFDTDKEVNLTIAKCLLEDGRFKDLQKWINKIESETIKSKLYARELEMIRIYLSVLLREESRERDEERYKDQQYYDYTENKIIHIYGPLDFIDSSETSISDEISYRIHDLMKRSRSKTDIMHCNIDFFNLHMEELIKRQGDFEYINIKGRYNKEKIKARQSFEIDCLSVSGNLNMLQHSLFDLLIGEPKDVVVTGSNLYCSSNVYDKNYSGKGVGSDRKLWRSVGNHDIITQFLFLQNIFRSGLFKADETLKSVLDMDVIEYVQAMEELHVFPVVFNND